MERAHKVDVPLVHEVDVSKATEFLLHELDCGSWYVACHREHQFVYRFSKGAADKYAVCFQCTPPVEKGMYHGGKAWSLAIIPLRGVDDLPQEKLKEIRIGLAGMAQP